MRDNSDKKYPCNCGATFPTAKEFSNHVHGLGGSPCYDPVNWVPSGDWMKQHEKETQE